jgi:hypothetical protein
MQVGRQQVVRFRPYGSEELAEQVVRSHQLDPLAPWSSLQERLDRAHGPYSGPLAEHLTASGVPTVDAIMGVGALVDAWEIEFGPLESGAPRDIAYALAVVRRFRPEFIADHNFRVISPEFIESVRRFLPGTRFIGSVGTAKRLHLGLWCDTVTTPYVDLAQFFRSFGHSDVHLIHHSFDPSVLTDLDAMVDRGQTADRFPVAFAGTVGAVGLELRTALIRQLLEEGLVEAWIREQEAPTQASTVDTEILSRLPPRLLGSLHRRTRRFSGPIDRRATRELTIGSAQPRDSAVPSLGSRFPDRCHEPVFGLEMFRTLAESRIVVHHGLNNVGSSAGALRLFEATGVGATLLTDDSSGLHDLFATGSEIVTYRSPVECVRLIKELQQDGTRTAAIGLAGQRRTLSSHTTEHRAAEWAHLFRRS